MSALPKQTTDPVFLSYGRCCNQEQFFVDFYDRLMESSADIRATFRDTNMAQQRHLVRHGIMQMVLHSRGLPNTKLRALGHSHSRKGYDIKPEWYQAWIDALIWSLWRHDRRFDDELETAWRRALEPGVAVIRGAY